MRKLIQPFLLLLLTVIVFHSWFLPGLLSTFDFPYFSPIMMKDASVVPYAWGWHVGLDGFAKFISPYSWVLPLVNIPQVIFGKLGMEWSFIERIMYLYPFLILMIVSPILLIRYIFPKNKFYPAPYKISAVYHASWHRYFSWVNKYFMKERCWIYLLSVLIFSFNTYALMLAGGEVFLALAYALAPMILMIFMKIAENKEQIAENNKQSVNIRYSIILGLLLSVQIMLDPRITYVTLTAVMLYLVLSSTYYLLSMKSSGKKILYTLYFMLYTLAIPLGIAGLLHAFWIIPSILHGGNPVEALGPAHSTIEAVKYFSFAKFENTISLLQPNWPENVFGKVGFMKPEFLFLPILAYASLFFVNRKQKTENKEQKTYILYFAFLGLVGAFLAKGANDPFGNIYLWMFEHVPGFIMFRDPTKWYPLVAISYSILVPFSIWKIYETLKSQPEFQFFPTNFFRAGSRLKTISGTIFNFQNAFLLSVICYLLFLIKPALLGQLGGMFKATNAPKDYVKLEKFLANQPDYFRTVWVPSKQKFGYYSNTHPEISAQTLFNVTDSESLFKKLTEKKTEELLEEASVKYVIVPFDSQGEIFLKDRKYSNDIYKKTINNVKKISYLKPVAGFGKIAVFEVHPPAGGPKDHFWSTSGDIIKNYKYINPTEYTVELKNVKKGDILVFSESYDAKWTARDFRFSVYSSKFGIFNSFVLPADGNYSLRVYYTLQDYVNTGLIISLVTLVICLSLSLFLINKKMLLFK